MMSIDMPQQPQREILICNDCGAKVNPNRIYLGGKRYICINCEHLHDDNTNSNVYRSVITPRKRSRSFQNKNRGNRPAKV